MIIRKIPRTVFVTPNLPRKNPEPPRLSKLVPGSIDIFIGSDVTTMSAYCRLRGVATSWPLDVVPINYNLDIIFDAVSELQAICTLSGSINASRIGSTTTLTAIGTISGSYNEGNALGETLTGEGTISGTALFLTPRKNWIQWAKFGTVDFTKDVSNKSGDIPLDWSGYSWAIKQLDKTPIVYGQNGVSILTKLVTKLGFTYGYKTIYRLGLKGKGAVVADDSAHYFIDSLGQMFKIDDKGLELLDYSEFLSPMTGSKISMSLDRNSGLIYICDGTYGFIYNIRTGSMVSGPINVSGLGNRDNSLYIVASAAIVIPGFEKWTDIHDMKTRKTKTIDEIEVGVDLTIDMQASIEWRMNKATAFARLPWQYLSPKGTAHLTCTGVEFRFGLKTATYSTFEIDSIKVHGVINDN